MVVIVGPSEGYIMPEEAPPGPFLAPLTPTTRANHQLCGRFQSVRAASGRRTCWKRTAGSSAHRRNDRCGRYWHCCSCPAPIWLGGASRANLVDSLPHEINQGSEARLAGKYARPKRAYLGCGRFCLLHHSTAANPSHRRAIAEMADGVDILASDKPDKHRLPGPMVQVLAFVLPVRLTANDLLAVLVRTGHHHSLERQGVLYRRLFWRSWITVWGDHQMRLINRPILCHSLPLQHPAPKSSAPNWFWYHTWPPPCENRNPIWGKSVGISIYLDFSKFEIRSFNQPKPYVSCQEVFLKLDKDFWWSLMQFKPPTSDLY